MKIVFFGTPEYVLPILDVVHKRFRNKKSGESPIVAVITQRPKPIGRKQILSYSPVDKWAHAKKIPVFYSSKEYVNSGIDADMGISASYGEIIPEFVIGHFDFGILNIHPSLLPKYRGASPVPATIVNGDKITGVTIIKMDEKVDHGPIVSQFEEDVSVQDTAETLRTRLFERSAVVLVELLEPYMQGKITLREQNHLEATFTTQIKKEHGFLEPKYLDASLQGRTLKAVWQISFMKNFTLNANPSTLERFIRAMQPWPIAWTTAMINGQGSMVKRLKILKAHIDQPSTISHESLLVIDTVQLEGKNPVTWEQFKRGYPSAIFTSPET